MEMQAVTAQPQFGSADGGDALQGLEALQHVDYIRIKQKIEMCELCTGCETKNRYKVYNSQGQVMFTVNEDSNCLVRWSCPALRPFDLPVKDRNKREVMSFHRHGCRFGVCFGCCCREKMTVTAGGVELGTVTQSWTLFRPHFKLEDPQGNLVFGLQGPCVTCAMGPICCCWPGCRTVGFDLQDPNGEKVGMIRKEFSGIAKEALTDADNFYATMPFNTDVKAKALVLASVFLLVGVLSGGIHKHFALHVNINSKIYTLAAA